MDNKEKIGNVKEEDIKLAAQAEPKDLKEKPPVNIKDEILEWIESFVFAIFVVILVFTFFFRIVLVDGDSMNNTLMDKDRLIVTHINYTAQKGDIVVLNSRGLDKTIIKRVVGTAGDKVVVDYNDNKVTVNGEEISNEHNREPMFDTGLFDRKYQTSENVYEYTVPEDCIFVMGDNRNNSADGRDQRVGFIKNEDVLGKAVFRLYPFESIGKVS